MQDFTLQQLLCFDAVAAAGSFHAAALALGRSHPSVFAAIANLEVQLGFPVLDRDGYRVTLTARGQAFRDRTRAFLSDYRNLQRHASHLATGEESALTIAIGDLCPLPGTLALLQRFSAECPRTRLHLKFEALGGPLERLHDGEADLVMHYAEASDPRLEGIALNRVKLVPVVAPGFLRFPISAAITPDRMRDYVQCVIRDTARHSPPRDYYLIEGAQSWTVSDQLMKKEIILQGMGWGHMPMFLVEDELRKGRLLSLAGRHFKPRIVQLQALRLRERPHGPVAERLWQFIAGGADLLAPAGRRRQAVVTTSSAVAASKLPAGAGR